MTKSTRLKAAEAQLQKAISVAIGAMADLSRVRDEEGLADPQAFYLAIEVDEIRAEHREELLSTVRFYTNPNAPEFAMFGRLAAAAKAAKLKPISAVERANLSWFARELDKRDAEIATLKARK